MTIQGASMDNNRLILVAGEPASGKSTLGRSLARRLGAAYLDMDTISFPFLERCIREDHGFKDSARYRDHYRDAEYRSLLATAADNLATGIDCIVVAPFRLERANPALAAYLRERFRIDATTVGIDIRIDRKRQLENIVSRGEARDAVKVKALQAGEPTPVPPPVWNVDRAISVAYADLVSAFDDAVRDIVKRTGSY